MSRVLFRFALAVVATMGVFAAVSPASAVEEKPKTPVVYFVGDSITQGIVPGKDYPEIFAEKAGLPYADGPEAPKRFKGVVNWGRSGSCLVATTCFGPTLLETFKSDALSKNPDWIVVGIGRNDLCETSDYRMKRGYKKILRWGKAAGVRVTLATIIPVGEGWWKDCTEQMHRINAFIRGTKDYVDHEPVMSNPATGRMWASLDYDGIHPNEAGHAVLAKNLMRVRKGAS